MDNKFNDRAYVERKSSGKMTLIVGIIIFMIYFAISSFSSNKIGVNLEYDGSVNIYGVQSTFWGLKKELFEVKYFPETSNQEGGWYAKGKNGEWFIMLLEIEDDYYDHVDY